MPIEECEFEENLAIFGGAVMVYEDINTGLDGCIYSNNQAQYGNDTFTRPHKLRLRVYQFDEMLRYTTELTLQTLLSTAEIV